MNIKIRTFFAVVSIVLILTVISISHFINELNYNTTQLKDTEYNRYLMILKADELRQTSDDLSKFANKYVITANTMYKDNYFTTLDIRNGKVKKPLNYDGLYWDLPKSLRDKNHPLDKIVSLRNEMNKLPYTPYEFKKLSLSENNSNDLVNLEVEAFNAMVGLFKDENGDFTIKKQPNQKLAIQLMNSLEYDKAKEKIMVPIDDFLISLKQRTKKSIIEYNTKIDQSFKMIYTLLIFGGIIFSIILILTYKKILNPIDWLTNTILSFQKGVTDLKEVIFYNDEVGLMTQQFFAMKKKMDDDYKAIKKLSLTDPLTNIHNRRYFFEITEQLLKLSFRKKEKSSLMILDIDFFKKINDTYGHLIGDQILISLVQNTKEVLRESDVFARFGGEEFIVFLPHTDKDEALKVANKIRKHIKNTPHKDNELSITTTVSIGITEVNDKKLELKDYIQKADEALYLAKENGRDKVEVN